MLFKIIVRSLLATVIILIVLFFIGYFFIPEFGLHITYPIRVLRGTEGYLGETRGVEVFFIWERIIIPFIFFSNAGVFFMLRKKLRL